MEKADAGTFECCLAVRAPYPQLPIVLLGLGIWSAHAAALQRDTTDTWVTLQRAVSGPGTDQDARAVLARKMTPIHTRRSHTTNKLLEDGSHEHCSDCVCWNISRDEANEIFACCVCCDGFWLFGVLAVCTTLVQSVHSTNMEQETFLQAEEQPLRVST